MSVIDDMDEKIMTPDGIGQYAQALITVQRKERTPLMSELKAKQNYVKCDEDEKELFRQILSGILLLSTIACLSLMNAICS